MVDRTNATGAGSGISPVPAPTKTDSTASTTGGLAGGPNTTWLEARKEPVRVADASARRASLDLKGIKEALTDLEFAELALAGAHNQHAQKRNDESQQVYDKAKDLYKKAQIKLGEAIEKQTNRLARDSSVYPPGRGLKNCGDVRQREQQIVAQATPHEKGHLEAANHENQSLRAPRALFALSQAMAKHKLNDAQAKEGRHIIADGTDAVTGKREGDDDLTREEVTKNQLDRLSKLLETITTRVDSATGEVHKFDKDLYNQLTENIRAKMGHLDPANNKSFDDLVTKYRPS